MKLVISLESSKDGKYKVRLQSTRKLDALEMQSWFDAVRDVMAENGIYLRDADYLSCKTERVMEVLRQEGER